MQNDNICKFIPTRSIGTELTTINFVYERKNFFNDYAASHSYSINIAVDGNGILHTDRGDFKLRRGDLFFTFPQQPYYIENENNFEYIYITFIGTRANALKERLSLEPQIPVLDNHEYLIDIWQNAIAIASDQNIDLIAEGTLLYSFAYICNVLHDGVHFLEFSLVSILKLQLQKWTSLN